jgi:hypothetical protein
MFVTPLINVPDAGVFVASLVSWSGNIFDALVPLMFIIIGSTLAVAIFFFLVRFFENLLSGSGVDEGWHGTIWPDRDGIFSKKHKY